MDSRFFDHLAGRRILITGGGGFLGQAIVKKLRAVQAEVASYSRSHYPQLTQWGCHTYRGDIADATALTKACADWLPDLVIHTAAKAGVWGDASSYYRSNVTGTQNVLTAMKTSGIHRLVYTSTPSVTFAGTDQDGVDESAPYTDVFFNAYQRTKTMAEQLVREDRCIRSISLRPHLIWGPGDNQLVPRIIERAQAGRLRLVAGGEKLVDAVYIDNAAHAHVLAASRLITGDDEHLAGKAYFVTNQEPWPMKDIINGIVTAAGLPAISTGLSASAAYAVGAAMEAAWRLGRRQVEPPLTRFVARQLSTSHWFNKQRVITDLGYVPTVSMSEGLANLAASLRPIS